MSNNHDNKLEKLEKLNAQIDVWIDDEDYNNVYDHTTGIKPNNDRLPNHDQTAESYINACFPEVNKDQEEQEKYCTHGKDKDDKWQQALGYDINTLPVVKVGGEDLDSLDKYWSHLFYAKLLRAKIKQKGHDCYTRRLDHVAAYLERHLPQQSGRDEWVTRLTLMYLLELSAVSQDWESLGFAERARRVIKDEERKVKEAREKAPYEFYEPWARYNIGVAYFHQGYYRKAILEFNWIIWQVEKWQKDSSKFEESLKFFKEDHHGIALLYLPAILYRAEVQLKLQFAYHSLDTLDKRFWKNKSINIAEEERTSHKKIHSMLIEAQAYQQMERLDKSWGILNGDANNKVKEKQEGICKLVADNVQLGQRTDCIIPERDKLNQRFPGLGERFIDILIADHLDWLTFRGEDSKQPPLKLPELVSRGDAEPAGYPQAVKDAKSYLNKLVIKAFASYFKVVEHHAYNRSGYFQQLAKYLAWLAKAADFKYNARDSTRELEEKRKEEVKEARSMIASIARSLYNRNREGLLFEEDKLDKSQNGCRYCKAKGIDLRRIESEHYTWFTEDILEFFNSKNIFKPKKIDQDRKEFVSRLIKLERKDRDDLRIHDLKLRYEFYGKEELLEELLKDDKNEEERQSSPHEKCAEWLCWREQENQVESLDLPICGNNENQENGDLTSDDYIKITQGWDKDYLRHLRSPSIHENQKGGFYFMGLQRWNSASPAKGFSVGGGYLLYHHDEKKKCLDMGIAIDPGFDFVRNLFHMGFSLDDIDIVLISHAHLDHIRDFESIVMLLSELKKRDKREKRVHVILSLGAYKRLEHIVEDPGFRYFVEPYIIDVDREINAVYFEGKIPEFRFKPVNSNGEGRNSNYIERFRAVLPSEDAPISGLWAKITPTRAYHDDKSRSDSFGFLIELSENNQDKLIFGYTGDTRWVYPNMPDPLGKGRSKNKHKERKIEDIAGQYKDCDVLLAHLGSLIGKDDNGELPFTQYNQCINDDDKYRCEKLVQENDHPYLIGMLRLLSSYYSCVSGDEDTGKPLVLVSEFGEELRGTIRTDFIRRLRGVYGRKMALLPVDVGLNVQMGIKINARGDSRDNRCACKVWCVQCDHFVDIDDADFELYGTDHALYCVCKTCRKAMPDNVLQERLRQLYEVGLELRSYENK